MTVAKKKAPSRVSELKKLLKAEIKARDTAASKAEQLRETALQLEDEACQLRYDADNLDNAFDSTIMLMEDLLEQLSYE